MTRASSAEPVFDQETSYTYLANMIIQTGCRLDMIEQPDFTAFIYSIQPKFRMIHTTALESEILALYNNERLHLMKVFGDMPGRVSLTVGLWTNTRGLVYICVGGHYINSDWKLQRKMLNFTRVVSPLSEISLTDAICTSLIKWDIKNRLFAISGVDGTLSHYIHSASFKDQLSRRYKLVHKGHLFIVHCFVSLLNHAAEVLMASIHEIIPKIRDIIKSSSVQDRLLGIESLSLDDITSWSTTFLMLDAAFKNKDAFASLTACDDNYNEALSADDWKKVEVICIYLKLFHNSANNVMRTPERTANIFFPETFKILLELTSGTSSEDPLLSSTAKQMHEIFYKYWRDCNLVLAIAIVMDPRFKLKFVEFSFSKIYGDDSARYIDIVNDNVHLLFLDYVSQSHTLVPNEYQNDDNHMNGVGSNLSSSPNVTDNELMDFDFYLSKTTVNESTKSELDQYLDECLVPRSRTQEFDVLKWWKLNSIKYPSLSQMAKDVLAIPLWLPDCIFFGSGAERKQLGKYQSSLKSNILEALLCARDWLRNSSPSTVTVKVEHSKFR